MITDTIDVLSAALRGVSKLRVYDDPGAAVDPPAAVLGPPTLSWDGYDPDPSAAFFSLALVAPADDRALTTLLGFLPLVVAAVDTVTDAVVTTATPGSLPVGGNAELPAYLLSIEVSL